MNVYQNTICVIPARRGSKRLPLKNLLDLKSQPMIAYSILEAIKSGLFEKVYVATEDEEIAEVARKYGAEAPTLVPSDICGDNNPSWQPCLYLADWLRDREHKEYKNLVCLQPTSPLRTSDDIKEGMRIFTEGEYDFLVSVTSIDPHYFHWAVEKDGKGRWGMYFGKKFLKERGELPEVWRPNGAIKIAKIEKLRKEKNFFGKNLGVIFMPEERSLHIATGFDLTLANFLLK